MNLGPVNARKEFITALHPSPRLCVGFRNLYMRKILGGQMTKAD